MNFSSFIARRYFLSKKKKNFINVISIISMIAVAVGTMSLVIVLSVFNGLEDFIRSLYNSFDPQLKVVPVTGKSFEISENMLSDLDSINGIEYITQVIEDNAYVKYRDAEMVVKVKGVDDNFLKEERLRNNIVEGELKLREGNFNYAIIGRGVQYTLNLSSLKDIYPLQFYYPKKRRRSGLDPTGSINRMNIMPTGVFAIEKQYDMNYILVPLDFAAGLTEYNNKRTSLEIKVIEETSIDGIKNKIQNFLGPDFQVLDSDEQHASFLRAIKVEKLFVYLTFSFIIAVAAFNIFFALTMLANC
ncbi:ABC transporter permease [Bacteroidota bacterium]